MIRVRKTDYIVGVWMVARMRLGRAYVYAIKGENEGEWKIYTKTYYDNESYNMFIRDNDHKNIHPYTEKCEGDIIRLCNQYADDLHQLFGNFYYKLLIEGNHEKYMELSENNKWLPPIYIEEEIKLRDISVKKNKKRKI